MPQLVEDLLQRTRPERGRIRVSAQPRQGDDRHTPLELRNAEDEVQWSRITVGIGDADNRPFAREGHTLEEHFGLELAPPRIVAVAGPKNRCFDMNFDATRAQLRGYLLQRLSGDRLNG